MAPKVGVSLSVLANCGETLTQAVVFSVFSPEIQIMFFEQKASDIKNKHFVGDGRPVCFASDFEERADIVNIDILPR